MFDVRLLDLTSMAVSVEADFIHIALQQFILAPAAPSTTLLLSYSFVYEADICANLVLASALKTVLKNSFKNYLKGADE